MNPEKEHTEPEKLEYPVAELLICMGEYQGCGAGYVFGSDPDPAVLFGSV